MISSGGTTGAAVSQLTNLGSGAGNATSYGGKALPTLNTSNATFKGMPTVHFNGSQALGGYDLSFLNNSSYTIMSVEAAAASAGYFLGTNQGAGNQGLHFGYRADTANTFTLAQYGNDLLDTQSAFAYSGTPVAREWTGEFVNGASHTILLNGSMTLGASNNNGTGFSGVSTNDGIIGAGFQFNNMYTGDLGEILIYNTALTATQQAWLNTYLQYKWGTNGVTNWASSALPSTTPVTLSGGGILDLNGAVQTIGSLTSSDSTTQVLYETGQLTTGQDNTNTTFAGAISGSGPFIKTGSGSFTLAGPNTWTGTTTISGGTLQIGNGMTGSVASTSITNNRRWCPARAWPPTMRCRRSAAPEA